MSIRSSEAIWPLLTQPMEGDNGSSIVLLVVLLHIRVP